MELVRRIFEGNVDVFAAGLAAGLLAGSLNHPYGLWLATIGVGFAGSAVLIRIGRSICRQHQSKGRDR